MEYQVQGEPGTVPAYPHHAPYGVQYTQHQGSMISENSHMTPNQGHPPLNSQHNSTNAPVNPCSQHRSLNSIQNQPQVAQKAYAVAVPQSSPLPHASNGYSANPGRPQPPLATPSQSSLNARNGHASQAAQQQARAEPPIDYQLLLMSIAEEYFAAAYGYGSMAAIVQREANMQEYYKLLATGLGCLEALLNHFKMLPETEAIVRLRYATILYEETENTMEAEEALSKGVSLCDRHRFFDLKYNMQHLLSRMLFKQNPRASLKFLDGVIKDVEAYQHIAWVYAFRFLKVSLHLELSTHQDTLSALGQLRQIINMSNEYGDKSILGVGTILEALTCLRRSSDVDSIEEAQRALASVRSLQLDPKIGKLHQLAVLASIVDLCCHLEHCDPGQAIAKMQIMQTALRDIHESKSWYADGSFAIPISNARMPHCNSSSGVVRKEQDGSLALMFDWMSKDDIYNLGYLLSGIALTHRNTQDGQKSEHMLEEGIKRMQCT